MGRLGRTPLKQSDEEAEDSGANEEENTKEAGGLAESGERGQK